jgi:AraC-like DNA-binding protein/mannose-6-phosphate isomerase-like protein (cupin superfamily)
METTMTCAFAPPTIWDRLAASRATCVICSVTPDSDVREARPGDGFAIDLHGQREMLFVLEGRSSFLYRDRVWNLAPGTLVAIDPWEKHAFGYRPRDTGLLHLWLHLGPDRISGACLGIANGRTEVRESFGAIVGTAFSYLAKRWTDASGERDATARGQILRHVCEMTQLELALVRRTPQKAVPDPAEEVAAIVEDYIARRHGRDCSLEKLERLTGYSRFHLSRLFHRLRGMTIGQAIVASRLRFLADAEAEGLKQCSIAEALGFSSPSAFCLWKRRNRPVMPIKGK